MADDVGQQRPAGHHRGGRGPARRPPRGQADRGRRGGRGQPRGQGQRYLGHREEHNAENGEVDGVNNGGEAAAQAVAPPREPPRRRVRIGSTALDRLLQLQAEDLILQITNRVSIKYKVHFSSLWEQERRSGVFGSLDP